MSTRYGLFFECMRIFFRIWLKIKFNTRFLHEDVVKSLKPPYLIIPNHQNTFDPFIIAERIKPKIFWVASDANFRSSFVSFWLGLVGAIPKVKGMSDIETVRKMTDAVKSGGVVGVFAEGERTWDGRTLPLIPSTAKLVRMLKVPVLCPVMSGGYVSLPRWSPFGRKGVIEIDFSRVLYPEDYAGMTSDQILKTLSSLIDHDDYAWQKQNRIPFVSNKNAEYLESLLFVCRNCGAVNMMESKGNVLGCTGCGKKWTHDSYGMLNPDEGEGLTPGEWYRQQLAEFAESVEIAAAEGSDKDFFTDRGVRVTKGYKTEKGEILGTGEVSLSVAGITMSLEKNYKGKDSLNTETTLFIPIDEVYSQSVIYMNQVEFYYKNSLYSLSFEDRPGCGIKWLHGINYIQGSINGGNDENKM